MILSEHRRRLALPHLNVVRSISRRMQDVPTLGAEWNALLYLQQLHLERFFELLPDEEYEPRSVISFLPRDE